MTDSLSPDQFGKFTPEAKIWPQGYQNPERNPMRVKFGFGPGHFKPDRSREMSVAYGGTREFTPDDRPDFYTHGN